MLRIGNTNIVGTATLSTTSVNPSLPLSNITEASLRRWEAISTVATITATFTSQAISHISLFNTNLDSVTVTGRLASVDMFSQSFASADLSGIDILNLYTGLSGTIDELEIALDNTSSGALPQLGYLWLGTELITDFENVQYFEESSASVEISDGNIAEQNPGFNWRSYNLTTSKLDNITSVRSLFRPILRDYAIPRPYIIECTGLPTECVLGVLDSNRIGYDFFENKANGERVAQVTVGIREIFGGSSR